MSAILSGFGSFFPLQEVMPRGADLITAILLGLATAAVLFVFAAHLSSRATRAFIGLALLFLAICYGAQNGGQHFALSVLWAGVLFGALDSLGKSFPTRSAEAEAS